VPPISATLKKFPTARWHEQFCCIGRQYSLQFAAIDRRTTFAGITGDYGDGGLRWRARKSPIVLRLGFSPRLRDMTARPSWGSKEPYPQYLHSRISGDCATMSSWTTRPSPTRTSCLRPQSAMKPRLPRGMRFRVMSRRPITGTYWRTLLATRSPTIAWATFSPPRGSAWRLAAMASFRLSVRARADLIDIYDFTEAPVRRLSGRRLSRRARADIRPSRRFPAHRSGGGRVAGGQAGLRENDGFLFPKIEMSARLKILSIRTAASPWMRLLPNCGVNLRETLSAFERARRGAAEWGVAAAGIRLKGGGSGEKIWRDII